MLCTAESICSAVGFVEKNSLGLPKCIPSNKNTTPLYQNMGEVVINLFSRESSINDLKIKNVHIENKSVDLVLKL